MPAQPAGTDTHFEGLSTGGGYVHRLWADAYLAAVAKASACRLVSFDADFNRFPGLKFLHLAASAS